MLHSDLRPHCGHCCSRPRLRFRQHDLIFASDGKLSIMSAPAESVFGAAGEGFNLRVTVQAPAKGLADLSL